MSVELRPIAEAERPQLVAMARAYWEGLMPRSPVVRDPAAQQRYFAERFRIGARDRPLWWIVADGAVVGFAHVELRESFGERWADVADFYIEPERRRRGLGLAAAGAVLAWLKGQGITRVDLNVRQDNPSALAFWQRVGFELASYRLRHHLG